MPRPYSDDLRVCVIEAVEFGASRREAAESFNLSPSSAVKWLQRWREDRSTRAKPTGGSTSPLEQHAEWLLDLVAAQPDMTLNEIVTAMRKHRIPGSRTAVWRFFERHNVTVKKNLCASEQQREDVARARRRWLRQRGFLDPARLVFIDETATSTNMVRSTGSLLARRPVDWLHSARTLENHDFGGGPAKQGYCRSPGIILILMMVDPRPPIRGWRWT